MTVSQRHLIPRAIALRKQKLSLGLIAKRLGVTPPCIARYLREHAPHLKGKLVAEYTLRYG